MTEQQNELRVQPERVILILKARLTEEIARTAILEAALQECQERERNLAGLLAKAAPAPAPDSETGTAGPEAEKFARAALARANGKTVQGKASG